MVLRPHGRFALLTRTYLARRLPIYPCIYISQRSITTANDSSLSFQSHKKLPNAPARTRFAPSPTGYLHLGSLRTALYNYLLAKATGGQFLLRIEDTDQKRTIPDALERICQDLEWTGLQWDEGPKVGGSYGPYIQSERIAIYRQHANQLLDSGHAYRCFCSAERLHELGQLRSKLGLSTDYDRTCAGISKEDSDDRAFRGERYTIRLKAPDAYPAFKDVVYGGVGKPTREARKLTHGQQVFEDPILLKSDGWPTYHLANVVDDHLMKITHVVRAVEWMPSTPKHVYLYQAFGWTPPVFAHVGLLQGPDNQKLSKRSGDIDIGSYRSAGVFPEALLNFAALLGWHHKQKSDMIELEQMISLFNFNLTKGNTVVNIPKLNYLSREYAKKYVQEGGKKFQDILQASITNLERHGITQAPRGKDLEEYVSLILRADPTSILDMANLSERLRSFFEWYPEDKAMLRKPLVDAELLDLVYHDLRGVDDKQCLVGASALKKTSAYSLDYFLICEAYSWILEKDQEWLSRWRS
ncbi:MAG: hypothetical protein GOMPHAMPRED_004812 [Gomphillus americanus]|uniref:Glutamate--tRNA ligase, mitochondrial n=1 Tax=Gomphillus americanus TaxID=1940652 RepID=A0A8H3EH31_9LECA|nr:MAG: hypothetical protein GOMPHAMPRED_004812 [Gomphillus americanus]